MSLMHAATVLFLLTDVYFKASAVPTGRVCPVGWYSISPFNSCFHLSEEQLEFDLAATSCKSLSSTLATIHSAAELQLLGNIVTSERKKCLTMENCSQLWIGLNVSPTNDLKGDSVNSTWVVGIPVSTTQSFVSMALKASKLAPITNRRCGAMYAGNREEPSSVMIKACDEALRYVCRKELGCPDGFSRESESSDCYKWIPEPLVWEDANKRCQESAFGAHLVMVTSAAESASIANYLRNTYTKKDTAACMFGSGPSAWTSGRRQIYHCNSPFVWMPFKGSAITVNYTNWVPKQPDCYGGMEICIHLSGEPNNETTWNDIRCERPLCSLCQLALS